MEGSIHELSQDPINDLHGRNLIALHDLSLPQIRTLLTTAEQLKRDRRLGHTHLEVLAGKTMFMMFFNPSLRTRNSFEAGIHQLGGHAHFLQPSATRLPSLEGDDEPYATERICDVARVLSSMGEAIAVRALGDSVGWSYRKGLSIVEEFVRHSSIPVINMEDNIHHPCQGLADLMTLHELFGPDLRGKKVAVAWVYSPSVKPIAPHHAFMYAASLCGVDMVFARPPEMRIDSDIECSIRENLRRSEGSYTVVDSLEEACSGADVVYAKNYVCLDFIPPWSPELRQTQMLELFKKYRHWMIDERCMRLAHEGASYMHCLPCDRGFEVTDAVLDGPWGQSVFREAENRLHIQKAIMAHLMNPRALTRGEERTS